MGYTKLDPLDPFYNIQVAIWLMSQGEYWRWQQSEHCWGTAIPKKP